MFKEQYDVAIQLLGDPEEANGFELSRVSECSWKENKLGGEI